MLTISNYYYTLLMQYKIGDQSEHRISRKLGEYQKLETIIYKFYSNKILAIIKYLVIIVILFAMEL